MFENQTTYIHATQTRKIVLLRPSTSGAQQKGLRSLEIMPKSGFRKGAGNRVKNIPIFDAFFSEQQCDQL